jgi:hypothetical protein
MVWSGKLAGEPVPLPLRDGAEFWWTLEDGGLWFRFVLVR